MAPSVARVDATYLLGIAVEHAAAAVAALAGAQDVRWQGVSADLYRTALEDARWQAAAVVARLEEERAAALAWETMR